MFDKQDENESVAVGGTNETEEVDQHAGYVPTEADYERARTVGAGNEPELPPGKVDRGRGK